MKYFLILTFLFLISCEKKEKLFSEISPLQSNIDFSNDLNENDKFNLVEYLYFYNGGGVTTGDINNDGLIDICLLYTSPSPRDVEESRMPSSA